MSSIWYRQFRGSLRRMLRRAAVAAVAPVRKSPLVPPNRRLTGHVPTTGLWVDSQGKQIGATYVPVHPPCDVNRDLPGVDSAVLRHFPVGLYRTAETYVASIPGGRTLGVDGLVLTPDGRLLMDVSDRRGKPLEEFREMSWLQLPRVTNWSGTVAVLGVRHCGNYYHWLVDILPRIELLRLVGAKVDRYAVFVQHAFQRDTLRMFGIRDDQIISTHVHRHIQAETLLVPSIPGTTGNMPPWVGEFLRRSLRPAVRQRLPVSGQRRRLYVSRRHAKARRVANEAEIQGILAAHDVETVVSEELSVAEQIALFTQAELVVGAHGAGLSNIVFCDNPCAIVELHGDRGVNPCFWAMASTCGFAYLPRLLPQVREDLLVSPEVLDATLREAIRLVSASDCIRCA